MQHFVVLLHGGLGAPRTSYAAGGVQRKHNMEDNAARNRGQLAGGGGTVADAAGLDVVRSAK